MQDSTFNITISEIFLVAFLLKVCSWNLLRETELLNRSNEDEAGKDKATYTH